LPDNLRDALCAEINSDFIWKTCEDEHIPDEKIYAVLRITGYVLMGFLHPDDASKEIQDAIGIDSRIADSIARTIKTRIFTPIQQSIDSVYNPVNKAGLGMKMTSGAGGPMMIENIQRPGATLIPQKLQSVAPLPSGVTLGNAIPATQGTAPATMPHKNSGMQIPKPVILQEGASFEPNKKSPDFHVEISEDKSNELLNIPRPASIKPVVLELGATAGKYSSQKPTDGARNKGEFDALSSPYKISPESPVFFGKDTRIPVQEKNRTITEITSSPQFSEKKPEAQTAPPIPAGNTGGQTPKNIPMIPLPPQIPGGSAMRQTSPTKPIIIKKDYLETDTASEIPLPKNFPPKA
jgi:hypothetical protein